MKMVRAPYIQWEKRWPEIKELLDSGKSAPQVEKETGIKATSINEQCRRVGYKIKRVNKHKVKYSDHDICLMLQLRYHGLTNGEIAEKFDCSYGQVSTLTGKAFKFLKDRLKGVPVKVIAEKYGYYVDYVKRLTDKAYEAITNTH